MILPSVEALEASPNRPRCKVDIRWPENPTPWLKIRAYRMARAEAAGRRPEECARRAQWRLDGVPMCTAHAGRFALSLLEEETVDRRWAGD